MLVGDENAAGALSTAMRKAGVFVPPAIYPAVPRGQARLRFCMTAAHKPEQIVKALDTLDECAKTLGIGLPRKTGKSFRRRIPGVSPHIRIFQIGGRDT